MTPWKFPNRRRSDVAIGGHLRQLAGVAGVAAPGGGCVENDRPVTLDLSAHPLPELAAAAGVARVLLNLDETITKN